MTMHPKATDEWAKDAVEALRYALQTIKGKPEDLYELAPDLAAGNRNIQHDGDKEVGQKYAVNQRNSDFQIDPDCRKNVEVNFLLAYLDFHVPLGLLSEEQLHDVMKYIIDHHQI